MSAHNIYHLFLSYSREDNKKPVNAEGMGWVTAFKLELERRHEAYSGRKIEIFFDQQAITEGRDWRRELGKGVRESRLFLAFLSPNYITSKNCLWEWEEYLRREHSAARGDDGITPVFFVTPADLRIADDQKLADWLAAMEGKYPWFKAAAHQAGEVAEKLARPFVADLNRRNRTSNCELKPWFEQGPEILKHLDAAVRSAELKGTPRDPAADPRTLAERLAALDKHIAGRLDRIALAGLAEGNVSRSHEHFVGRHRELSELHTIMTAGGPQCGGRGMGGRGMIAAAHSPGGLGKTALARQYAHAYAEFYPAGGTWEVGCEGASELGAVMLRLADNAIFQRLGAEVGHPLNISENQRNRYAEATGAVLDYLKIVAQKRIAVVREALQRHPEVHSPEAELPSIKEPRALLILDNVDQPELLAAAQVALIPAEEWLEVIVTTRLDPARFGGTDRTFAHVEVDVLPETDALHLLRDFQPGHRFPSDAEEDSAREIVRVLGGYTLAVELVAAYLGDRAKDSYLPSQYLAKLTKQGITRVDDLAADEAVKKEVRHREEITQNHVATLVRWSLERLSPPARSALEFASLLMPDEIPLEWLQMLCLTRHNEALTDTEDDPPKWPAIWRELHGLRLLHPAGEVELDDDHQRLLPATVRLHRLIAGHVAAIDSQATRTFAELDKFLDALTTLFEQKVGKGEDTWLRTQHPWLRDQLSHLIAAHPATPTMLSSAQVVGYYEGTHGSLSRGLNFFQRILRAQEELLRSPEIERSISATLNSLADFLARRGAAGDAEQALLYLQRGLQVNEALLAANPQNTLTARDVSLSLNKMADHLARRGHPEDAEQALSHYQRALRVREDLLAANPPSTQAARDVSVSLIQLAGFLASLGEAGDAEQALSYYQRGLQVSEDLLAANPQSTQAARDVLVSLNKLADFLAKRRQAGDAEQALSYYQRDLAISEDLLAANPQSAQAVRDVLISLERLSKFESGQNGGEAKALEFQIRSLELALGLRKGNPGSYFYQRTAAVAFLNTFHCGQAAGQENLANQCLAGCFSVLDPLVNAGVEVDPPMLKLHAQLKPMFSHPDP